MKRIIVPPYDNYGVATFVVSDQTVYISHFGGSSDEKGEKLITIEEQTMQTFSNLEKALKTIDLDFGNLAKVTVILKKISDFQNMHEIWLKVFRNGEYPARTTITSDFVDAHCLIQIDATAVMQC